MVYNRTGFGNDFKPLEPSVFWPPSLLEDEEKHGVRQQQIPKVSFKTIYDRMVGQTDAVRR